MEWTELIIAYGHELIRSTHRTTFEITKEHHLTEKGDCIIAVRADKTCADLSRDFREAARKPNAEITITIEAGGEKETVKARGDQGLSFTHPTDIVVRKSSYICSRTLAVKADKAAADLSRRLVEEFRNPNQKVKITLTARVPD
jgi:hypothetical protein